MYYEVNLIEAIMAHHEGKHGFVIRDDNLAIQLSDALKEIDEYRFIIDDTELERTKDDPVPEIEIPEAKLNIETPERKKPGPKPGSHRRSVQKYDTEVEQKVLKAWAGEKTIQQVCDITGYSKTVVQRYLPRTVNG